MKRIKILPLCFFSLTMGLMIFFPSVVFSATAMQVDEQVSLTQWLSENWQLVVLIISELLAFLPSKYTGIAKGLLTILGKIINYLAQKSNK